MKSKSLFGLAIVAMLVITGCATQGPPERLEYTMPRGEKRTMVVNPQPLPNWLMSISEWKMNFVVKGTVTDGQLKAVAIIEESCRWFAERAQPPVIAEIAANTVLMSAFSALGVGVGAHYLAKNIDEGAYARYGGAAGAASGAASGVMAGGGRVYTIQTCLRDLANIDAEYGIRAMR